jgi:hypothetical protein
MRNLILSALILASAFQTAKAEADGSWIYSVENNQATITRYMGFGPVVNIPSEVNGIAVTKIGAGSSSPFRPPPPSTGYVNPYITSITIPNTVTIIGPTAFGNLVGLTSITIPNSVTSIEMNAFYGCTGLTTITIPSNVTSIGSNAFQNCTGLTSITIPNSVTSIGGNAFSGCTGLTTITIPNSVTSIEAGAFSGCTRLTSISSSPALATDLKYAGVVGQVASDAIVQSIANALANNDAFVTAVANKIKGTSGNYGIATQSGLSSAITTAVEPLATKTELTASLNQSRTDGINSVLSNPNLWTLYTTSQIQNMAVDDLVLTRTNGSNLVLNYDIEQSEDLQTWTTYQAYALPLTNLPTNKAFVRIKAKQ